MPDAPRYPRRHLIDFFRRRREEGERRPFTRPAREVTLEVRARERLQRLDFPKGITSGPPSQGLRSALRGSVSEDPSR